MIFAPIAQRIEYQPPELGVQVQFLLGANDVIKRDAPVAQLDRAAAF